MSNPQSNAGISPNWDSNWPTVDSRTQFRPRAPRGTDGDATFWIFWEGTGDVFIERTGEGSPVTELDAALGATGQTGQSFPLDINQDPNTDLGMAQLRVNMDGTGNLTDIEIVHEDYLGGAGIKCFRCIPGPDGDGWYWQKGLDAEDDSTPAPIDNYVQPIAQWQ